MGKIGVPQTERLPLATKEAAGVSINTGESLVNMYAEPGAGEAPFVLLPTPGLLSFATIGGNPVRFSRSFNEVQYVIVGENLYTVDSSGTETLRNPSLPLAGTAFADGDYDGNVAVFVSDNKSYVYDITSAALSEIVDPDFNVASSCAFIDQRIVFSSKNSAEMQWGGLLTPGSIDTLDFATAEQVPDKLRAVRAQGGELIALGYNSIEFWRSTATSQAAFVRSSAQSTLEIGSVSRDCFAKLDNTFYWLGRDKETNGLVVYRAAGGGAQRVSTHAVERILQAAGDAVANAHASTYQQSGHTFYCLTIPGWCTVVFDVATGLWHRRVSGTWTHRQSPIGSWAPTHPTLNGSKLVVGLSDGNIYELSETTYTENGSQIIREIVLPPFTLGGQKFTVGELQIFLETGVSATNAPGDDAVVSLSYSDDGCRTWSGERRLRIGARGKYETLVRAQQLGDSRRRSYKLRFDAPVPFKVTDMKHTITPGL